jgi:cytochrome c
MLTPRLIVALLVIAAGVGGAYADNAEAGIAKRELLRGKLLFLRCASCHDISTGPSPKIGPNLLGVVGRKAGCLDGFAYSPALKAQNIVWDDANLDRWLTNPGLLVPGTAMAFAGLPEAADRKALIAYLRR